VTAALRLATFAEKRARDEVTFAEWGTRLTLPQYLEREQALRAHPWSQQGMETWLLTDGGEVLSSCETFRNASHVSGVDGESYAIASVFTEEQHRGKGHANRLMFALQSALKTRETAQGLVLFSDVGASLYERSGFRAEPAFDWVLPPMESVAEVEWLSAPLPTPPRIAAPSNSLVLQPSTLQLDWHHLRSRLYARLLSLPPLRHYGARTASGTAWWTAQFKSDELLVLWLDAPDAEAAAPLLEAAQAEAHRAGLPRVRVWETLPLTGLAGAQRFPRDGELPMSVALNATFTHWRSVDRALWV